MAEASLIEFIFVGAVSLALFFMKRTLDSVEADLKESKAAITKIKEDYLQKEDFKEFKGELRSMFEEIRKDVRSLQQSPPFCPKE